MADGLVALLRRDALIGAVDIGLFLLVMLYFWMSLRERCAIESRQSPEGPAYCDPGGPVL